MRYLIRFAFGFVVGFTLFTVTLRGVGPWLVSKAESWDLDDAWDVFNTEVE